MAEFIQLTDIDDNQCHIRRDAIVWFIGNGEHTDIVFNDRFNERVLSVKESPSEVLALLSPSVSPAGGALDEVRDVVNKLVSWNSSYSGYQDAHAIRQMGYDNPFTVGDLRRLIAALDKLQGCG